ncbi:ABC transporter permease subunit [Micromonospora sp. DT81.3]|uniref:ABC transporter permease subunit n=1 Tax=Micromonospora sp. DT81.3 TaxID=3416523 RepID=UPI003CF5D2E6
MTETKLESRQSGTSRYAGVGPSLSSPGKKLTSGGLLALVVKVVLLGVIDALAIFGAFVLLGKGDWVSTVVLVVLVIGVNYIYLRAGLLPAKYLTPGLFFLAVFQILVIFYTGYIAFTNYGDQHNSTKEDAVAQIIRTSQTRVPDSPTYPTQVFRQGATFGLLVSEPDGDLAFGTAEQPLQEVNGGPEGWEQLNLNQIIRNQDAILAVSVPLSDDPNDGSIRTQDGTTSFVFTSDLVYDEAADTFTDTSTGEVYVDDGQGNFTSEGRQSLTPGWRVVVGWDNFAYAFNTAELRDPLLRVTAWTFAFAFLSVLTCFAMGLFLAIVFNHPTLRGKKGYRILIILPYAFPAFLSGLVWAGLLNEEFGFINQVLLGGAEIPWLGDPWLARLSVLLVNLWLGFPYMFLVCTGALQALPDDILEAAKVDGAGAWRIFRAIKLPLLFVSVAPLLIASFAFNFNNFVVIYMMTRGWPRFTDTTLDIGATDLLISMVYKVAFGGGGGRDYGLASALSIIIFLIVGVIAIILFRQTKALEDLN